MYKNKMISINYKFNIVDIITFYNNLYNVLIQINKFILYFIKYSLS